MRALLPRLRPTDIVLDIGAGTGRHAAFLADHVAGVVAMEPSASMRGHLEQRLAASEAWNMTVVSASWPIAICTHVIGDHSAS